MQPGPASSAVAAVLLVLTSFWTGTVVQRPAIHQDLVQQVPLAAAAGGAKRRRRRSEPPTTTPAPRPVEAPRRVARKRLKQRSSADRQGSSSGSSFATLATVVVASVLVGAFAHQHYGRAPVASSELVELAPGLSNDRQLSPTKQAPPVLVDPLELGVVGDRSLLATLARREVRK